MLAQTPPMGFNTWNTFGSQINDTMIRETADAMVEKGLKEAGYEYLVIDDCWSERQRDPVTDKIIPDHVKFPNGMKAVSDYVHSKGLKFGLYSCAGVRTCANYPGSFDHEFLDAETFAEYGADFLKYDYCYAPGNEKINGPLLYRRMGMALRASGREILFSACNWGKDDVEQWIRSAGAHMYRSTGDINDSPNSFKEIAKSQLNKLCYSMPGCYNDMDMLVVGMYGKGNVAAGGCTDDDYLLHFALWCMFNSPLMIGCDVRTLSGPSLSLLTNKDLIAIDKDPEARPPINFYVGWYGYTLLFKLLSDGSYAILAANATDNGQLMTGPFFNLGLDADRYGMELTDLMTGERIDTFYDYVHMILPPHKTRIFRGNLVRRK